MWLAFLCAAVLAPVGGRAADDVVDRITRGALVTRHPGAPHVVALGHADYLPIEPVTGGIQELSHFSRQLAHAPLDVDGVLAIVSHGQGRNALVFEPDFSVDASTNQRRIRMKQNGLPRGSHLHVNPEAYARLAVHLQPHGNLLIMARCEGSEVAAEVANLLQRAVFAWSGEFGSGGMALDGPNPRVRGGRLYLPGGRVLTPHAAGAVIPEDRGTLLFFLSGLKYMPMQAVEAMDPWARRAAGFPDPDPAGTPSQTGRRRRGATGRN